MISFGRVKNLISFGRRQQPSSAAVARSAVSAPASTGTGVVGIGTFNFFTKHLFSTLGEVGIQAAIERANPLIEEIAATVEDVTRGGDIRSLFQILSKAVNAIDSYDLRDLEVPLRTDLAGHQASDGGLNKPAQPAVELELFDSLPRAGILAALLEAVLVNEPQIESILLRLTSCRNRRVVGQLDFNAALALSKRFILQGRFDEALSLLDGNLALKSFDPASQYLGYKAYAGKEAAGELVTHKRINTDDLTTKFCSQPFEVLASNPWERLGGNPILYACSCTVTLPYPVTATSEISRVDDVWNGEHIQELRRSILDGDFKYCSRMNCGYLVGGQLPEKKDVTDPIMRDVIDNHKTVMERPPKNMLLAHDASCNIACPSCRSSIITSKNAERKRMDDYADYVLLPFLENAKNGEITLDICGDGDPFGSKHYRRLIYSLDPVRHKHVKLRLITNGLLLTEREWEELTPLHNMIQSISVSIDAAAAPTYEDVRRPGKWNVLVENMKFLGSILKEEPYKFYFSLNFVVQKANYREIPEFVLLGKSWNAHRVLFQRILNLNTYDRDDYLDHDVSDHRHPEYEAFNHVLADPILHDPIVNMYTLSPYSSQASAS